MRRNDKRREIVNYRVENIERSFKSIKTFILQDKKKIKKKKIANLSVDSSI